MSFTAAWIADDPAALALLPGGFGDAGARADAVARAAERRVHPAVLEAVEATTEAQRASREALATPGAAVVVTGQQAGLFGGPLYTIYKAAAAIADAAALSRETGVECVPVFWLQNEDHDYDEIATCHVLGTDGRLQAVSVPGRAEDAGRSIAHRRLGPGVVEALDRVEALLGGLSHAPQAVALLRRCYAPEVSPDRAFRELIEALFARHGLLVLDPTHPALIEAARPVHRRALDHAGSIAAALTARSAALEAAGFEVQVHVRPGAPLSFFHPDGPAGPRFRIEPVDGGSARSDGSARPARSDGSDRSARSDGSARSARSDGSGRSAWAEAGGSGSSAGRPPRGAAGSGSGGFRLVGTDRVVDLDSLHAGAFTTSALLRPILQDTLLPTAAYVGGPGEIAYFAQLPPLYAAFDLPVPLVVPRARFRVVDETAGRLLDQLGLAPDDLGAPRDRLLARLARGDGARPDPSALEASLLEPVRAALGTFGPHAASLDPGLAKATDKTLATVTEAVGRLAERYRRTLAQQDEVTVDRLDRLIARLQPDGAPQERVHGWPWFAARFGVDRLVDVVLGAVTPFEGALAELRP